MELYRISCTIELNRNIQLQRTNGNHLQQLARESRERFGQGCCADSRRGTFGPDGNCSAMLSRPRNAQRIFAGAAKSQNLETKPASLRLASKQCKPFFKMSFYGSDSQREPQRWEYLRRELKIEPGR